MIDEHDNPSREHALDQAFAALAADDCRVEVPPRIEMAVMRAWDLRRAETSRTRWNTPWQQSLRPRRAAAVTAALGVIAVSVWTFGSSRPTSRIQETSGPRLTRVEPPRDIGGAPATEAGPRRAQRQRVVRPELAHGEGLGFVLAADAIVDPQAVRVVRMRVPRTALANFGIPIADPEARGVVEVELLVGEDGIARSIRRVAAADVNAGQE